MKKILSRSNLFYRVGLGVLLMVVLAIGFLGYMTPGMRLNWETIATMCGF
jgi:hypothetical protein